MGQGTAQGPHLDSLNPALMQQPAQLARGRPRGDHVIEQGDMPIGMGVDVKGPFEIAAALAGTELSLLRGCPNTVNDLGVEGDAGQTAQTETQLLCLIETTAPLAPPMQWHRDDCLGGLLQSQMIRQQPGEQGGQQQVATIFQTRDKPGVGRQIVPYHLQPLPGGWSALATATERPDTFERGGAELAAMHVLAEADSTAVAEQGGMVTGLPTEQAEPEPVGRGAEDRTCFGEQAL